MKPRRVVKLGGSLLERSGLAEDLRRWFELQPPVATWVVIGGGEVVEGMRALDRRFVLDPTTTHWRCIELMDATWEVGRQLFPEFHALGNVEALERSLRDERPEAKYMVRVGGYYTRHLTDPFGLATDWSTTSDALAAVLAHRIAATELVLLKSCVVDAAVSLAALAERGVVDREFERVCRGIPRCRIEQLGRAHTSTQRIS